MTRIAVAVVGGGQAGLATSYWLTQRDIDHVVFDRGQTGDSWRHRWDSFCLVTPNWTLNLPGFPYDGDDPDGFIPRDRIVDYLVRYRTSFDPPVKDKTAVHGVGPVDGGWRLTTDNGEWIAGSVVIATGAFPIPSVPAPGARLSTDIVQMHSYDYRNPESLPPGGVLVVGSGQSGGQIVDDLHQTGRDVWLALGSSGAAPRRYRGRDTVRWLAEVGYGESPLEHPEERFQGNPHVSGRDGGKDLNLRAFGRDGVHLLGRVVDADGTVVRFADDVPERLRAADDMYREIQGAIDQIIEAKGIEAPPDDTVWVDWTPDATPTEIDLSDAGIGSVIWATGYHLDFSWIDADVFGARGYPDQERGVTAMPGLYFVGLHGMYSAGSGLFWGVGADAEHIVNRIEGSLQSQ